MKFKIDDWVVHTKGVRYNIKGTPYRYRIDATGELAYAYSESGGDPKSKKPIWVRSQKQMEEGRFRLLGRIGK